MGATLVLKSAGLAERQIYALWAQHLVMAVFERKHTMMAQARRAAPDHDIAVMQRHSSMSVGPRLATEQENRRQAERYGNDGCAEIAFVLVLVQREACTRFVSIEQTRIGNKSRELGR
jgi:hypothetical protein